MIGWDRRQPTGAQTGVLRRGLGVGTTSWKALRGPARAEVVVHRDGSIELRSGAQDIGTGFRTIIGVAAADALGVPLSALGVRIASSTLPEGPASGGSVTTPSITPAVISAARDARSKLLDVAAKQLGADAKELSIVGGEIRRGAAKAMTWNELCRVLPTESVMGSGAYDGGKGDLFGNGNSKGVQFVEVEVDSETGVVAVKRVIAFQACGRILCRKTAESQVIGGVIQGISFALFENKILDRRTGAMVNPNLEMYKILGPNDMPSIEPVLWSDATQTGSRGLGEPPVVPTAGAVACAVFNAVGAPVRHLPLTPDKVLAALDAAAAKKGGGAT
ncbi:MAG: molybdopterin cofactor-binding domain-containing protein [Phycisphaerales bacterium]